MIKSLGNDYDDCGEELSNNSSPVNKQELIIQTLERIENIPCLPVLPEEIFFYAYPETITCSNPSCCNSLSQFKLRETSGIPPNATVFSNSHALSIHSSVHHNTGNNNNAISQSKRRSQAYEVQELLSPIRGSNAQDESLLVKAQNLQNTNRRMTGTDDYFKNMMRHNKKANIHEILQREINSKQYPMQGGN